jgi:hypothetical protein
MTPTTKQYREGFSAHGEGQSIEANPYPYGPLMVQWNDGWFAAHENAGNARWHGLTIDQQMQDWVRKGRTTD